MNASLEKAKGWLGLVGVFLVGVLVGVLLTVAIVRHCRPPQKGVEMFVDRLTKELALTPEEKTTVTNILKSYEPQIQQINRDKSEAMRQVFEESNQKIRSSLTPEQQVKFDELIARLRERWEKKRQEYRGHR